MVISKDDRKINRIGKRKRGLRLKGLRSRIGTGLSIGCVALTCKRLSIFQLKITSYPIRFDAQVLPLLPTRHETNQMLLFIKSLHYPPPF